ncbi:hypothetical protein BLA27_20215 [Brucella cytisi]|uniref:Uncharacterized protein n=1 Tax=Brucella cytisi TaxID=407152 RepID=A0A1J6HH81_9HYPH|nr:hypothetical protein BLA27_20215 [Brucella cytisi]
MSILAMSLLMRPYTLTQTDQNTVKSSCNGAGHTFFKRKATSPKPGAQSTPHNLNATFFRQTHNHLVKRDIFDGFDHFHNEILMRIKP